MLNGMPGLPPPEKRKLLRGQDILNEFGNPEEINDGPDTSPSKRLECLKRGYRKVAMGKTISASASLSAKNRPQRSYNYACGDF